MRTVAALCLLLAACTADNPDYDPTYTQRLLNPPPPDLTDHDATTTPDMTVLPDFAQPPPDLLPGYLAHVGEPCDGGAPSSGLECRDGLQCVPRYATCTTTDECCDHRVAPETSLSCCRGSCLSYAIGAPCRTDEDCCFLGAICSSGSCRKK